MQTARKTMVHFLKNMYSNVTQPKKLYVEKTFPNFSYQMCNLNDCEQKAWMQMNINIDSCLSQKYYHCICASTQHLDKQKCFKHTKWKFNFVKSEHNKNKIIFFMYSIKIQLSRHQKAFFHSTLALTALSINKLHITLCYTALCASEFCMNTSHFATGWKLLLFLHEICIYPSSFVINFCKICMPSAFVCLLPCRKMCAGVGNRFPSYKSL